MHPVQIIEILLCIGYLAFVVNDSEAVMEPKVIRNIRTAAKSTGYKSTGYKCIGYKSTGAKFRRIFRLFMVESLFLLVVYVLMLQGKNNIYAVLCPWCFLLSFSYKDILNGRIEVSSFLATLPTVIVKVVVTTQHILEAVGSLSIDILKNPSVRYASMVWEHTKSEVVMWTVMTILIYFFWKFGSKIIGKGDLGTIILLTLNLGVRDGGMITLGALVLTSLLGLMFFSLKFVNKHKLLKLPFIPILTFLFVLFELGSG